MKTYSVCNMKTYKSSETTITSSNNVITSGWYPGGAITVGGTYGAADTKVRKKCVYCDCLNNTEYGTCKYCGAPLGHAEDMLNIVSIVNEQPAVDAAPAVHDIVQCQYCRYSCEDLHGRVCAYDRHNVEDYWCCSKWEEKGERKCINHQ